MQKVGLFLGVTPHIGGAFQYSQSLLKAYLALPEDKYYKVIVYTDKIWENYLPVDVEKIFVRCTKWTYLLGVLLTLTFFPVFFWKKIASFFDSNAELLKRQNCNLWIFSSLSFLCYQMPVSSLGIVHDLMHRYERFPENSSLLVYFWREQVFKRMCKYCRALFVDSEIGKQQLLESYKNNKDKIFPLPFIPPEYIYNEEVPDDFDEQINLPKKYIFYPAQFWEHKNHIKLLKAIACVMEKYEDISLVLVGYKKNAYNDILKKINELNLQDNVIFLGYVPDEYMPELYKRARGLIYPTFFGPTNIPPLEAMAVGCPMAVSNVYAMSEQCGDAALYFDPKSIKDMAKCIGMLWSDDELCNELKMKGSMQKIKYTQNIFNDNLLDNLVQIPK
ncbi:MAG TPA: glycosyltransferase family 1 protein [Victivallales bacterium]|nr:glycosyltransferase family 1 protein [Victivallales bacterium]